MRRQLDLWLPLVCALVVLLCCGRAAVVDEEIYLFLARQLRQDPLHPYEFWRAMQPWHQAAPWFEFAHPPLHWTWLAAWMSLLGERSLPLLRVCAALPPALLLGWAAGRLVRRCCPRPGLVAAAWLASPVTLLALSAGLMIDLSATALATAGVAAWRETLHHGGERQRAWLLAAGALLGLGVATKYPMLVLALAVGLHALRLGRLRSSLPLWLAFFGCWGAVELWIGLAHGGFHPLTVLAHAGEIGRGPMSGRFLGVLVRLGLAMAPLLLLLHRQRALLTGAMFLGSAAVVWALPPELSEAQTGWLAFLALLGAIWLINVCRALLPRRKDRHQDDWLLGCWVLGVLLAVVLGHNFASGRYLLPAMLPLACLVGRRLEGHGLARAVAPVLLGVWAVISVAMLIADARYVRAVDDLARVVIRDHEPGWFTGEWAFRYRLERAGWQAVVPPEHGGELPPGAVVVTPTHAGAGPLPLERLELLDTLDSDDSFPLRTNDVTARVGYYGETLGALPLGWRRAPLEQVQIYRVAR